MPQSPILVTGAAGRIGGVGGEVVAILRSKGVTDFWIERLTVPMGD